MTIFLLYLCEVYFQNITVYTCQIIIFLSLFVLDCLNSDVVYKASVIFFDRRNKQKLKHRRRSINVITSPVGYGAVNACVTRSIKHKHKLTCDFTWSSVEFLS